MKRLINSIAVVAVALSLAACSTFPGGGDDSAPKQTTLERIKTSGIIKVGMSANQPPFNVKTRDGKIIGLDADLANALAETIGVRAEFVEMPFSDLIGAVEAGEIDMAISQLTMTPERNTRVAFAGPYFISGKAILTKSETLARADEASDINQAGITLTALAGSTSEMFVKEAVPSARLIATTDYDQAVNLVITNEADAMVADLPICVISVLRHPDAGLTTLASPFTFEPLGIALPADDALFINLVQNYVNSLEGTGLLTLLKAKWFVDGSWLAELP
jgi:polar amino acid transport system substrate-binding protein